MQNMFISQEALAEIAAAWPSTEVDFTAMIEGFTPDAEMVFQGVPVGPFIGRDAIADAYTRQPPSDEVRLLGAPRVEGDDVESDYAWATDGRRAGRMIVSAREGAIARLVVTFE